MKSSINDKERPESARRDILRKAKNIRDVAELQFQQLRTELQESKENIVILQQGGQLEEEQNSILPEWPFPKDIF